MTPENYRLYVTALLSESEQRQGLTMVVNEDQMQHILSSIRQTLDVWVKAFGVSKRCVTFESLRDSMDENKLIEAALKYHEHGDNQPLLSGFREWVKIATGDTEDDH